MIKGKIQFMGESYYSLEDLILNADMEELNRRYKVVNDIPGETMDMYQFLFKRLKQILEDNAQEEETEGVPSC